MSDDKQIIKDFWNYRSQTFDKSPGHYNASQEEEDAWKLLLRSKIGDSNRILDIGSGTGFLSIMLADMGYHVTGIDLSEQMISQASNKAKQKGLDIRFLHGDAEDLNFIEENSYDAIVNRAVLWTLPNPDVAVRDWMRVLKPGGKLCFFLHEPQSGTKNTLLKEIQNLSILISERRNPWRMLGKGGDGVNLPLNGGARPMVIVDLLKKAGYCHVIAEPTHKIDALKRNRLPLFYRLSQKHNQFCYTAEKPKEVEIDA